MKQVWDCIWITATVLTITVVLTVTAVEWLAGCGDTWVDAQGQRHRYDCLVLPNE